MPTKDHFRAPDGQAITLWRWPFLADRPTLHWAHATGFHARTYSPLLNRLADHVNIVAWDMRGHGASRGAGDRKGYRGWQTYYNDLAALLDTTKEPIWLAGHSVGGMTSLAAAAQQPGKVLGLMLIEPVILDHWSRLLLGAAKKMGLAGRFKLAAGAARRRRAFPSRKEAYGIFRSKAGFRSWPDPWLAAYVEHGFVAGRGGQVHLACDPAWESLTFTTTEHRPWRYLGRLRGSVPVHVLAGERGSTFPPPARRAMKRRLPQARIEEVAESSHFLPMEHPEHLVRWVCTLVGGN